MPSQPTAAHAITRLFKPLRQNLKYRLFLMFVLVISVPVLFFGFLSYKMSASAVQQDFIKYKSTIIEQISKNIDENINSLTRQSMAVYNNLEDVLPVLTTPSTEVDTRYLESYKRMDRYFQSVLQSNDRLDGITLVSMRGEVIYHADKQNGSATLMTVEQSPWFKEALDLRGFALLREPHVNEFIDVRGNDRKPVLSIARAVIDLGTSKYEPSGVLLVDQNVKEIQRILENTATEQGEISIVLGESGEVVYANRPLAKEVVGQINELSGGKTANSFDYRLNGERMLTTSFESSAYKWKVVSLIPYSQLQKKSLFLKKINLSLFIVLIVLAFVISIAFSHFITTPLKKLMVSFRSFQRGDFHTRIRVKGQNELSQIGNSFNVMVENTKKLIEQKYEMTLLRNQSELKALQNQINPHFLYNTLTSIKTVIDRKDHAHASIMVQHLSDLFRYNLSKRSALVPFSEELEQIRKYLSIQEFRFQDRFEVFYDIDEQVMSCRILRLTLQPIVENALYHGLEPKRDKGDIRITAKTYDDCFYVYIHDSGIGIAPERLEEINAALEADGGTEPMDDGTDGAIGIANVDARIKYHFGDAYGLKITSAPLAGTTVKITLPNAKGANAS